MQRDKKLQNIEKTLSTLLGRTPDLYGLLPDPEGWFPVKTLLQALSEEQDFSSIREADLVDICREKDALLDMEEKKIRARHRSFPSSPSPAQNLPKLLHVCIREKAWPHVFEKGLRAGAGPFLILSSDPDLSLRMGKRKGPKIVPLKIQIAKALQEGASFLSHGELFCAKEIPASAILGPPLPSKSKKAQTGEAFRKKAGPFMPGSFLLRSEEEKQEGAKRKKEKNSWKHNKKRLRKEIRAWEEK